MPALTSPWFYQRNPQLPPQLANAAQTRSPSTMTEDDVDQITKRVGRPTQASKAKLSQSWKLENTFMDNGRHAWAKMNLYADCKKCMWKDNGVVKSTYKIRPVQPTPR